MVPAPAGTPLADVQRQGRARAACYLCAGPPGTTDDDLIRVAGSRWATEECFQTAKNETGLDQYQVRRYDAWYRHITLAILAHAYLCVTPATAPKALAAASSRTRSARPAVSWHT
jgi:SRSO17 transposase